MSQCGSCPSKGNCNKTEGSCGIENNPMNHIKNIIGVMSGKGGVGKSSISVLFAKQLAKEGYKVGLLDADITGPSIPRLLRIQDQQAETNGNMIYPVVSSEGIKVMSLNLLIEDENQPVIWRGPVIAGAVKQFYTDVLWGELDYLVIDMPPGTGDVPLTVLQSLPLSGVLMVSVPQDFVSMIVTKAVHMAEKMNIPVLGIIENMSYIECPDCGKKIKWFNGEGMKEKVDVPVLGELPMLASISNLSVEENEQPQSVEHVFEEIVKKVTQK